MGKINLVIADYETEYIELIKSYLRQSEYQDKYLIKSFSQTANFASYLQTADPLDLFLITEDFYSPDILKNSKAFILTDKIPVASFQDTGAIADISPKKIYKYQPLNKLFSQITSYFLMDYQYELGNNKQSLSKIITIYSAGGGVGKTTLALNLLKYLTSLDKKVLYLNLELLNPTPVFFLTTGAHDLSKIIYYLKTNRQQLAAKLESYKKYDPLTKAYFFEPFANPIEVLEITQKEIEQLLDSLVQQASYDYIIVEHDAAINEQTIAMLNKSDYLLWMLLDDLQNLYKTNLLIRQLEQFLIEDPSKLRKISYVQNKYLGEGFKNIENLGVANIVGCLPYIPAWKTVSTTEQLFSSGAYLDEIGKLLNLLEII